jgi:hypothetical protein
VGSQRLSYGTALSSSYLSKNKLLMKTFGIKKDGQSSHEYYIARNFEVKETSYR